jgi:hypothetical protein
VVPSAANGIIETVKSMLAKAKERSSSDETERQAECLYAAVLRDDGLLLEGDISVNSVEGRELEVELLRLTRFSDWICPAKANVPHEEKYCGRPIFSYEYSSGTRCMRKHVVRIFKGNTLQYYVSGEQGISVIKIVDSNTVRELRHLVLHDRRENVEEILLPEPDISKLTKKEKRDRGAPERYFGANGAEAESLHIQIGKVAALEWKASSSSEGCNSGSDASSSVIMRR